MKKLKRLLLYLLMIIVATNITLAGHLNVSSPEFEDGSHEYDGEAEIDADTVQGLSGSYIKYKFDRAQFSRNVLYQHVYDNEEDIEDINDELDIHKDIINDNSQSIVNNWIDNRIQDASIDYLDEYINDNEDAWNEDDVGGRGMSKNDLSLYMLGFQGVFKDFKTILDYLKTIFALRSEINKVDERLDRLETVVGILMIENNITIEDLDLTVALTKAKRDGLGQYKNYSCKDDGTCVKNIK